MVPYWPPLPVLAHGFTDAGSLPLPTPVLLAVSLGALIAAAALTPRRGSAVPPVAATFGRPATVALRILAVLMVLAIALPAAFGPTDTALNPAGRLLFTVGWAGLLLLSALIGGWWSAASPLALAADPAAPAKPAAPADRQKPADRTGTHDRPAGAVWWAVGGLVAFGVAEQVMEPTSVLVLVTLGVYLVVGVAGALLRGRTWLAGADPVQVASDAVGAIAPLGRTQRGLRLRSPRRGAADAAAPAGLGVFLGVLGGINVFDALAPGGGLAARLGLYLLCVVAGAAVVGFAARPGFFSVAFIPAIAGHLAAHYLAPLLVDTQIAAVLASDPLRRGWNLLGLTGQEIVAEPISPTLGLALQVLLLVGGHALAMVVASDLAARHLRGRAANAALFPVRAAIVASLVLGVYLRAGGV